MNKEKKAEFYLAFPVKNRRDLVEMSRAMINSFIKARKKLGYAEE